MSLPLFPTTLVGSYPQPDWLIDRSMLAKQMPPRVRAGHNANAFRGGFRLWTEKSWTASAALTQRAAQTPQLTAAPRARKESRS